MSLSFLCRDLADFLLFQAEPAGLLIRMEVQKDDGKHEHNASWSRMACPFLVVDGSEDVTKRAICSLATLMALVVRRGCRAGPDIGMRMGA